MDLNQDPQELLKEFLAEENGTPSEESATEPGVESESKTEDEIEASGAEPNQDEQQGKSAGQADDEESKAEGIATADGKHIIPITVLKVTRKELSEEKGLRAAAETRIKELEAIVAAASQGAKQGESARTSTEGLGQDLSAEELESLKEDFPTVYKAVMTAKAKAEALEAKLKPVEERERATEAERERMNREAVQDAIDSVPKLAYLQSGNPEAFELAKRFDAQLLSIPAWSDKPMSERFAKVAEMVESAIGAIELPGNPPSKSTSSPSAAELAKAAKARAAEVAKKGASVPTSLSEFPAGLAPAADEQEMLENISPVELGRKLAGMTPEQLDAYLSQ